MNRRSTGGGVLLRAQRPGLPGEDNPLLAWEAGECLGPAQAERLGGRPLALLLHGWDCSLFDVAAPRGIRPQEWGVLLEDRLLEPAEALHLQALAQGGGRLRVVLLRRALLEAWRVELASRGLVVSHCWVDFQLLPEHGLWQLDSGLRLRQKAQDAEQWLCAAEMQALPPLQRETPAERFSFAWPSVLPPTLWPTAAPRRRGARAPRALYLAGAAALLFAALHLGLHEVALLREGALQRDALAARLGVPARRLSPVQAERLLRQARQFEAQQRVQQQRLDDWLASVRRVLREQPGWQLAAWQQGEEGVRLELRGDGDAEALFERLQAGAADARLQRIDVDSGLALLAQWQP